MAKLNVKATTKLNVKAWVFAGAILCGPYLFIAALMAKFNLNFFGFSNSLFAVLDSAYPGLSATFIGAIIGLIYGLVYGGIITGLFALLHNLFLDLFGKKK